VESGDRLRFVPRAAGPGAALDPERLVAPAPEDSSGALRFAREAEAVAAPAAVRVAFFDREAEYAPSAAEARRAEGSAEDLAAGALSLALDGGAAQAIAERWLAEASAGAEELRCAAPPSMLALEPGDVVEVPTALGPRRYRIDRITDGAAREIVARRVEAAAFAAAPRALAPRRPPALAARAPLAAALLDLPARPGASAGVYLAAFGAPWPGSAAIWTSADGDGWAWAGGAEKPSVMGELVAPPPGAAPHRWDRGAGLVLRLWGGGLAAADRLRVLNGANCAALETDAGDWEILQFCGAELVGPNLWRLTGLLRGQAGTEDRIAAPRSPGARFVLLDGAPVRVAGPEAIGLTRRWRVGPAHLGYADESYVELSYTPGAGLARPLAPAALRARREGKALALSWARRSPEDVDSWAIGDAHPLPPGGAFRLAVEIDGAPVRAIETSEPAFLYTAAMRAEDGAAGSLAFSVSEIGPAVGAGPAARIVTDG
jgi:hypothetical protein